MENLKSNLWSYLLIVLTVLCIGNTTISCETSESVKEDLNLLKTERDSIVNICDSLATLMEARQYQIDYLNQELKERGLALQGRFPKYILKLKISQSHLTLDIGEHIKDAMNEVEVEISVDKEYYNSVRKGDILSDEFRVGSLLLRGSFGNWEIEVSDKTIKY